MIFNLIQSIVGAELFKFVGLKADLGALVIGMLIANHKKSRELSTRRFMESPLFNFLFFKKIMARLVFCKNSL